MYTRSSVRAPSGSAARTDGRNGRLAAQPGRLRFFSPAQFGPGGRTHTRVAVRHVGFSMKPTRFFYKTYRNLPTNQVKHVDQSRAQHLCPFLSLNHHMPSRIPYLLKVMAPTSKTSIKTTPRASRTSQGFVGSNLRSPDPLRLLKRQNNKATPGLQAASHQASNPK